MSKVYDSLLSESKILICFHKSCVDGLFSTILFLLNQPNQENFYDNYLLIPLTPTEISKRTERIKQLEPKRKIILDLPYFGSNVLFYYDHHITNENTLPKENFNGLFDLTAASTCSVLEKYFNLEKNKEFSLMIEIANIIDQAKFSTAPPEIGPIHLQTKDDIIWACNDLIKDVRDDSMLLELIDSFDKDNLKDWILNNKKYIMNYRKRRQETLDIKKNLLLAPIIIIKNESYNIQAEGLHFSLVAEEKDYLMLVLLDKVKSYNSDKKSLFRISFRLNPKLDDLKTDELRVDRVASSLGGGGHKGAASASIHNFQEGYTKILTWIHSLGINYSENKF